MFGAWAGSGRARRAAALGLGLALSGGAFAAGPAPADLEVMVSSSGFRPKVLRLRRGESVRLVLRSSDREHCFAVDELRIEKRVLPGRETWLDLTPERVGSFDFYSCLAPDDAALRGRLIVAE
jgi:hypothetical protein